MPIRTPDGTDSLSDSNLALSLNATCRALALAFVKGGLELDEYLIEHDIPGLVFKVAVDARWLIPPKTPAKNLTLLDVYEVSKPYREKFVELLKPTFDRLNLRHYQTGWVEPTPSQLLKQFKYLTGWSDQRVADEVRKVYTKVELGDREPISVKTIRRIQNTKGQLRHNARPDILQSLATVMKNARSKDEPFCYMHWRLLRWKRKK